MKKQITKQTSTRIAKAKKERARVFSRAATYNVSTSADLLEIMTTYGGTINLAAGEYTLPALDLGQVPVWLNAPPRLNRIYLEGPLKVTKLCRFDNTCFVGDGTLLDLTNSSDCLFVNPSFISKSGLPNDPKRMGITDGDVGKTKGVGLYVSGHGNTDDTWGLVFIKPKFFRLQYGIFLEHPIYPEAINYWTLYAPRFEDCRIPVWLDRAGHWTFQDGMMQNQDHGFVLWTNTTVINNFHFERGWKDGWDVIILPGSAHNEIHADLLRTRLLDLGTSTRLKYQHHLNIQNYTEYEVGMAQKVQEILTVTKRAKR